MNIPIKLLDSDAAVPAYAHAGDAGVDLRTTVDFKLAPFERLCVPCGIAVAIPEGYAGLVMPRSGLAAKHGVSVVNGPGLIDSNYRGEIKAILINLDPAETFEAKAGDRIAQLVFVAVPDVSFVECDNLDETVRGDSGFGSSGLS